MKLKLSQEYYISSLLGGAIGDALGAPIEFMSIRQIKDRYGSSGVTGYVEYQDGKGEFTDDTQMTLFTAEGLLRSWQRQANKGITSIIAVGYQAYLRWLYTQGMSLDRSKITDGVYELEKGWLIQRKELFKQRSPGNTCLSALQSGIIGEIHNPINDSKGCGGIMRVAPVGLIFLGKNELSFQNACDLAAITHDHPSGYLSAGFFASVISDLAIGEELESAIKNALIILQKWEGYSETQNAVEFALSLYKESKSLVNSEPERIPQLLEKLGGGWVGEEALSISLFCSLIYKNDFRKGVLASVNHSGDSDSTGSITGNILGLINGLNAIPEEWIANLRYSDIVREIAEDLHTGIKEKGNDIDKDWWNKYPGY
ncbi:MAG: ADP-ribosylglycohydrolase family protein [Mariniphaga sp.]